MNQTRFLIAKFAPDLRRMEPRNFGVVVWSNGEIISRFAGETTVGGKSVIRPPAHLHMESANAYRQWVDYWRLIMSRSTIKGSDGVARKCSDPEFVDILKSKSREQFMLVEGGYLLDSYKKKELQQIADELFEELVARPVEQESQHRTAVVKLKAACKQALDESGLPKRSDFFTGYPCTFHVGKASEGFQFDYGLHDKHPEAIFQRVAIWNANETHSTAFRFQHICQEYSLDKQQCASLIYATKDELAEKETKRHYALMREMGTVINMTDISTAAKALRKLAPTVGSRSTALLRHNGSHQRSFLRRFSGDDSRGS